MAGNLQDEMYDVFEQQQDAVMARVFAARLGHEHGPQCEMRCPQEQERRLLMEIANDLAKPFEKFFIATEVHQ